MPEQFFPASDRPELLVDLKLQDNASILATRDVAEGVDQLLAADPDIERFSTYVGQGAIRFYLPLDVALPNDFFAQSVVVTKGLKQREQVRARLEQALAARFPEVVARVYPLELGPPVGWPVKYRVSGPEPQRRALDLLAGRRSAGRDGGRAQRQLRLGRAGARHAHPHRPGPGEAAWPQFAGRGTGAERCGDRQHGDAGARQHLPDRRGRAGRTGAADLARIAPLATDPIVQRAGGSAAADRDLRVRPGISDRLAAGPRPDPDGAGRCGAGRAAGDGGAGRRSLASTSSRRLCRTAIASRPAARWRKAARRRLR